MKKTYYPFIFLLFLIIQSCSGEMFLEKSANFNEEYRGKIKKIVLLEPDIIVVNSSESKGDRISLTGKKELQFNQLLQENAGLCGIETQLIDANDLSENDLDYFKHLLPLKEQIFIANVHQDVTHEKKKLRGKFLSNFLHPQENYFEKNPRFLCEFSWMSEEYGTPYFGVYGVYSTITKGRFNPVFIIFPPWLLYALLPDISTVFFSVLVDVETGEVIYREVRTNNNKPSKETLNSFLYDSFRIISRI